MGICVSCTNEQNSRLTKLQRNNARKGLKGNSAPVDAPAVGNVGAWVDRQIKFRCSDVSSEHELEGETAIYI